MPKQEGQKSKLLTLLRILEQKTDEEHLLNVPPVSYTHLDVYKRQSSSRCWNSAWAAAIW